MLFAVTLFRILMAYHTQAMRYGLCVMEKGADEWPGIARQIGRTRNRVAFELTAVVYRSTVLS